MTTLTFTLSAGNTYDQVQADYPQLAEGGYYGIIGDMIRAEEFGVHTVEINSGNSSEDGNNPNARYVVMFFPEFRRAAISDNGSVRYTDAVSMANAHHRYLNDEMVD